MSKLDPGKLTSVDQSGARIQIIPAEVRGFFRKHRDWTQIVLLIIFLALPWTKINGHQTIFLDLPNRQFALFGVLFRSHDAPLMFFVIATFLMALAFVTAVWGRVWCGWACPQTVFIDGIYRRIEIWVEGNYIQRRKLRDQPLDFKGFLKKSTKWFLFFAVSSLIAHSFIAYFVGSENLMQMIQKKPSENFSYFLLVASFTGAILFNFGWFREQFCVIMCPYGRLQGLFLGQNSLAVVYDVNRGEPRKGTANPGSKVGDCVSCNRCVQVCPTGIDIRNGLQMECITCTACIDACDEIMEKVKKPKGLIRYDTLDAQPLKVLAPRPLVFSAALVILVSGLAYALVTRSPVHFTVLRGLGLPYTAVANTEGSQGSAKFINHFRIHLQNQSDQSSTYELQVQLESPAHPSDSIQLTVAENPVTLLPGQSREWHFFIQFQQSILNSNGKQPANVLIKDSSGLTSTKEITLLGPTP